MMNDPFQGKEREKGSERGEGDRTGQDTMRYLGECARERERERERECVCVYVYARE